MGININEVSHRRPHDSEACHRGYHSEASHWRPQDISESCYCDTHSEVSHRRPQDISEAFHRGAHRMLVWPAIASLTVRPAIVALLMIIIGKHFVKEYIT